MNTLEKKRAVPRWRQIVADGLAAVGYYRPEQIAEWIASEPERLRAFRRSASVGRPSPQARFEFASERSQLLTALDRIAPRTAHRVGLWKRSRRRLTEFSRTLCKFFR